MSRPVCPMAMVASLLVLLMIIQLADVGHAQAPAAGTVKIESFTYTGSGCPYGSAVGSVSDDRKALTFMFSKYTASTDPPQSNWRKNCVVSVKLIYPPGFVLAVGDVTHRGYARLDDGVTGTIQTSYYFSGLPGTASAKHIIEGYYDDNFEFTDSFLTAVWSRCGSVRDLNLNSEIRVNLGKFKPLRAGIITIDSQDLELTQVFHLLWKTC